MKQENNLLHCGNWNLFTLILAWVPREGVDEGRY